MQDILKKIEQADDQQLNEIMDAISEQYRIRYPDWEVVYMAVPAITPERKAQFHADALALLSQYRS